MVTIGRCSKCGLFDDVRRMGFLKGDGRKMLCRACKDKELFKETEKKVNNFLSILSDDGECMAVKAKFLRAYRKARKTNEKDDVLELMKLCRMAMRFVRSDVGALKAVKVGSALGVELAEWILERCKKDEHRKEEVEKDET